MSERDVFRIDGMCWCADDLTIGVLRVMGHSEACTTARKGHEENARHLSQKMARRRMEDENAGRQLRQAAEAAITEAREGVRG